MMLQGLGLARALVIQPFGRGVGVRGGRVGGRWGRMAALANWGLVHAPLALPGMTKYDRPPSKWEGDLKEAQALPN